jgi:hypothetical protein
MAMCFELASFRFKQSSIWRHQLLSNPLKAKNPTQGASCYWYTPTLHAIVPISCWQMNTVLISSACPYHAISFYSTSWRRPNHPDHWCMSTAVHSLVVHIIRCHQLPMVRGELNGSSAADASNVTWEREIMSLSRERWSGINNCCCSTPIGLRSVVGVSTSCKTRRDNQACCLLERHKADWKILIQLQHLYTT